MVYGCRIDFLLILSMMTTCIQNLGIQTGGMFKQGLLEVPAGYVDQASERDLKRQSPRIRVLVVTFGFQFFKLFQLKRQQPISAPAPVDRNAWVRFVLRGCRTRSSGLPSPQSGPS